MPLTKYNGTALEQIIYNGVDLDEVYYNGVLVFSKPVVFNGSKFGGQLKDGVLVGPTIRAYGSLHGTSGFDQAASGTIYTAGAISDSHYFTSIYADGTSIIYGGFITRNAIDLTNISTIKIDQTFEWWVRDITTSSPDWVTVTLERIFLCTQDGTRYIMNNSISGSPYGVVPGYNGTNGNNTTIGGYSFNLSSYTGSYYIFFNFTPWCEVANHNAKCTINKITITYTG